MFWLDEITEEILQKYKKDDFLIADWFTPSGKAHIGSLRGVIVHDLIRQGLEEKGKSAIFQFGFDDMDPMDGMPNYIDPKFEKYMGIPLFKIPAPDGKSESFADQYRTEFEKVFEKLGIKPKIVRTSELYKSGKFDKAIKIILDNADAIREIYKKISGSDKGKDWHPLQVICPNCGKIGTTKVIGWDGKLVEFECVENLVEWAKGCGEKGKISPFSGNAKLPWKVEWPSKWFVFKNDVEGEGKDHFASGGSRDIANEIYRSVFKSEPPFDIHYEHFLIGGAKMSTSKGLGTYAKDMANFLPANIFKFLFTRTRPKKTIEFDPASDTIPLLYDEFDRASLDFQKDPKLPLARAYHFSQINFSDEQPKYNLRFSKIAYMLQMPRVDILEYAEKEKRNRK
jgi:lysyl-tRNA synthetase class 1